MNKTIFYYIIELLVNILILLKIKGEYENEKKISNLLNELNLDDNNISK